MKNLIQNAKNLLLQMDILLDYFWIRIVQEALHRKAAELYRKRAASVQSSHVYLKCKVPTEILRKLRHQAASHDLEAKLIREMFV